MRASFSCPLAWALAFALHCRSHHNSTSSSLWLASLGLASIESVYTPTWLIFIAFFFKIKPCHFSLLLSWCSFFYFLFIYFFYLLFFFFFFKILSLYSALSLINNTTFLLLTFSWSLSILKWDSHMNPLGSPFDPTVSAGGIDRYFQLARCFRDESGRSDRQPVNTCFKYEVLLALFVNALLLALLVSQKNTMYQFCLFSYLSHPSTSRCRNSLKST